MKTSLYSILFVVIFVTGLFASDTNRTMTDDEMMQEIMKLDQQIKNEKQKQAKLRQKQEDAKTKTKNVEKLEKTVNELGKQLGVD